MQQQQRFHTEWLESDCHNFVDHPRAMQVYYVSFSLMAC